MSVTIPYLHKICSGLWPQYILLGAHHRTLGYRTLQYISLQQQNICHFHLFKINNNYIIAPYTLRSLLSNHKQNVLGRMATAKLIIP